MLLSAKKGFFIDSSEHVVLLARTTSPVAPLVIEELIECAPAESAALSDAVKAVQLGKPSGAYLQAKCGVGGAQRVVRRLTIDPKRLKEPAYLGELTTQQLKIDPAAYTLAALNPLTGCDYDMLKATQKDMLVCGLPTAEIGVHQAGLLAAAIYPLSIELGSLASVGAMVDYLNFAKIKSPVLMLEIEAQTTNSYIVSSAGLESSRTIAHGLESMIPFVQKELGLKDEAAARKLFISNSFDFTGMGSILVKKIIKELQSSIGFYEVQTGQSISQVLCTALPSKLAWLEAVLATDLGVSVLKPDIPGWLQSHSITLGGNVSFAAHGARCLGLLGLMVQSTSAPAAAGEKSNNPVGQVVAPAWHSDFRIATNLPDIKPVRTMFYVNGAALLVTLCLGMYIATSEVSLSVLKQDTENAIKVVNQNKKGSADAIALFNKFKEQEKCVIALQQFLPQGNPVFADLVLHLGAILPSGITLESVDYRATGLVIKGTIKGPADAASGLAYNYADVLRNDKELGQFYNGVTLSSVNRDAGSGFIRFEVALKVKGVGTNATKGKK